jgi:hypothetical protein
MGKIVLLPLDERPCNAFYPTLLPVGEENVVVAPLSILGHKKEPADFAKIAEFLRRETRDATTLILSFDMLLYGGIVPSRLHHLSKEELLKRADLVQELRQANPALVIDAFELMMRCPYYSSSDEEPDYYESEGSAIYKMGYYEDLAKTRPLSAEEEKDYAYGKSHHQPAHLEDYLARRQLNNAILFHNLGFVKTGLIHHFVVPQDDSSPFGYTAMDKRKFRAFLKEEGLEKEILTYPGADEVGISLLSYAMLEEKRAHFKVYPLFSSEEGKEEIPPFEDRPLKESVPAQILASGGTIVSSPEEADLILAVNACEPSFEVNHSTKRDAAGEKRLNDFVSQLVNYAAKKKVAVADTALTNGSDTGLLAALSAHHLLLSLASYAGWNTSGNTIGTTLGSALLYCLSLDEERRQKFLLYRYYEDYGYMAVVRAHLIHDYVPQHPGLSYFLLDGVDGGAAHYVAQQISQTMARDFPLLAARVEKVEITQPWNRCFETSLRLRFKENKK